MWLVYTFADGSIVLQKSCERCTCPFNTTIATGVQSCDLSKPCGKRTVSDELRQTRLTGRLSEKILDSLTYCVLEKTQCTIVSSVHKKIEVLFWLVCFSVCVCVCSIGALMWAVWVRRPLPEEGLHLRLERSLRPETASKTGESWPHSLLSLSL